MKIEQVFTDGVTVGERHRQLDFPRVVELADSMKRVGLLQPITVYTEDNETVHLVAGLHRLEAARMLKWDEIDAIFVDADEIDRELMEITENLHRADLTKEQRDEHIRRYAELISAKDGNKIGQSDRFSEVGAGRGNKGLASKVAEQTGLSQRTVRRALARSSDDTELTERRKEEAKARKEHNDAIALSQAEEFAGWLAERISTSELATLISWIEGTKKKQVIDAVRRIAADRPIMDAA